MYWKLKNHRLYYSIYNENYSMSIRFSSEKSIYLFSYLNDMGCHYFQEVNVKTGLDFIEQDIKTTIQQSEQSLKEMHEAFDELREILGIKISSLQAIARRKVATFFTLKTTHHIDTLEIPESLKEDVKWCVC